MFFVQKSKHPMLIVVMTLPNGEVTPETIERTVNFSVNDGDAPIGSATIVIDSVINKTTGSAGGCSATLTDGEHTVEVSKEGYVTKTETITVSENSTSFTISLTTE